LSAVLFWIRVCFEPKTVSKRLEPKLRVNASYSHSVWHEPVRFFKILKILASLSGLSPFDMAQHKQLLGVHCEYLLLTFFRVFPWLHDAAANLLLLAIIFIPLETAVNRTV
jgi:hypothetical protein